MDKAKSRNLKERRIESFLSSLGRELPIVLRVVLEKAKKNYSADITSLEATIHFDIQKLTATLNAYPVISSRAGILRNMLSHLQENMELEFSKNLPKKKEKRNNSRKKN